jgi:hypothetical protein
MRDVNTTEFDHPGVLQQEESGDGVSRSCLGEGHVENPSIRRSRVADQWTILIPEGNVSSRISAGSRFRGAV